MYTRKQLVKILNDNNISTTAKSIAHLMIVCMDNHLVTKEDIIESDKPKEKKEKKEEEECNEKRRRGRPKLNSPKEKILKGYSKARAVRLTNQETGEVTEYRSLHKARIGTGHGHEYFLRNNGKVIDGILYETLN